MFYFTDQRNEKIVSYTRLLQNVYMNRNKAKLKIFMYNIKLAIFQVQNFG